MPKRKVTKIQDFEIEFVSIGQPDPVVAAKAILPLILELWNKKLERDSTVTHAAHE